MRVTFQNRTRPIPCFHKWSALCLSLALILLALIPGAYSATRISRMTPKTSCAAMQFHSARHFFPGQKGAVKSIIVSNDFGFPCPTRENLSKRDTNSQVPRFHLTAVFPNARFLVLRI